MKLRQHLREIRQTEEETETLMDLDDQKSEVGICQAGPSTEEDLVGKYTFFIFLIFLSLHISIIHANILF